MRSFEKRSKEIVNYWFVTFNLDSRPKILPKNKSCKLENPEESLTKPYKRIEQGFQTQIDQKATF